MFRKKVSPEVRPEWLIVGLGNPGPEYRGTRHNVGFDVIDRLAEASHIRLDRSKHRARFGIGLIDNVAVILVKPLTYMNLSGQAVAPLMREYDLPPSRVLVVADDLDLPLGKNRVRAGGSSGGHNGHKSLIQSLGTQDYPRIKIGIGSVDRSQTIDHVLGAFTLEERDDAKDAIARAADAVLRVLSRGVDDAANWVNGAGG
jgi:PTH1 family peptidyl-tRNA hydrolase